MIQQMLGPLWLTLATVVALFLWWSRRADLAAAGWGALPERQSLALSTGGSAGRPRDLTEAQRAALRSLSRPEVRERVMRWLARLGVALQDREDLAQAVLVEMVRSIATYDSTLGPPERWLNQVTVHVGARFLARARHRREVLVEELEDERVDEELLVDERLGSHEEIVALWEALAAMPHGEPAVLIAHDLEGREMKVIADELRMPLSTAYKRRARTFATLVAMLTRERA